MQVALFITCLSDVFYPSVGMSVVRVLRRLGVEVDFPTEQTCCGQPAFNSGYRQDAAKAAKQMIRAFEGYDAVITPSGSCAAMVRKEYPHLLNDDSEWKERAQSLADRCYEFSEFLVSRLSLETIDARLEGKATYHHSCHMYRGLRLTEPPLQVLSQVQGLEVVNLPYHEDCCGFGGTFAVKMSEISQEMADEKIQHLESTEADYLIGSDMSCLMHLGGRIRRKEKSVEIMHVAQVLDRGMMK